MILVKIPFILLVHGKEVGKDHCHAGAHLEISSVHRDLDTSGDIDLIDPVLGILDILLVIPHLFNDVLGLAADCVQTLLQTRKSHSHDDRVFALRDHRTVVNIDIGRRVIGKGHAGHSRERHVDIFIRNIIGIFDADPDLSALARQVFGRDLLSVQIVGDLFRDRRLLRCRTLIINILSAGIPGDLFPVPVIGLIALDIFYIRQIGKILELVLSIGILEPVGDRNIPLVPVFIRENINRLLLGSPAGDLADRLGDGFLQINAVTTVLFVSLSTGPEHIPARPGRPDRAAACRLRITDRREGGHCRHIGPCCKNSG